MRRRTFIAAAPMAAAAASLPAGATGADAPPMRPPTSSPQPVVRGGDRIAGAPFASRSVAYGLHGAAATAHPLATLIAIDLLARRRLGGRRGDRGQRGAGLPRAGLLRRRRRLLRHGLGSEGEQARRPERLGPLAARPHPGDAAGPRQGRPDRPLRRHLGFHPGRGRRLVDPAPTLWPPQVGRPLQPRDRARPRGRARAADHRRLPRGLLSRLHQAGRRDRGDRQLQARLGARRPHARGGRGLRQPLPRPHLRAHRPRWPRGLLRRRDGGGDRRLLQAHRRLALRRRPRRAPLRVGRAALHQPIAASTSGPCRPTARGSPPCRSSTSSSASTSRRSASSRPPACTCRSRPSDSPSRTAPASTPIRISPACRSTG